MNDNPNSTSQEGAETNDELYQRFVFNADKGQEAFRIDKFLMNRIEGATRNKLQQAINTGLVLVNNKEVKQNYKVKAFDQIVVYSDLSPESTDIVPENIPLNIVYEDKDILLINKPAGMVVHPGSGNYNGTLLNGVAYYLQQKILQFRRKPFPDLVWFTASIKIQAGCWYWLKATSQCVLWPNNFMITR